MTTFIDITLFFWYSYFIVHGMVKLINNSNSLVLYVTREIIAELAQSLMASLSYPTWSSFY